MKKITYLSIVILLLFSCNTEEFTTKNEISLIEIEVKQGTCFKLPVEEAKENLLSFLSGMEESAEGAITTRSRAQRIVKNVEVIGSKEKIATYSSVYNDNLFASVNIDTFMYLMNFDNNQGFAIVSADRRSNNIYAIIDEGSMNVEQLVQETNLGFYMFMNGAIKKEIHDIAVFDKENEDAIIYSSGSGSSGGSSSGSGNFPITPLYVGHTAPRLKTKWGQNSPYGSYCPNKVAGCLAVAITQLFSYYETIDVFSYYNNSYTLNWSRIISDCENKTPYYGALGASSEAQSTDQIAHLMRYVGYSLGATYNVNGQTTMAYDIGLAWLANFYGIGHVWYLNYYSANQAYINVSLGNLIFMKGRGTDIKGQNVGHAWIIDGGVQYKQAENSAVCNYYVHCNWGWHGRCDGYYMSELFNLYEGADYWDENIDNDPENGQPLVLDYSFDTAIMCKK